MRHCPAVRSGLDESAFESPRVLLEIPNDIVDLRREQPALAERWRAAVGQAFQAAFAAGYRAVDFVRDDSAGRRRSFYVLERYNQPRSRPTRRVRATMSRTVDRSLTLRGLRKASARWACWLR